MSLKGKRKKKNTFKKGDYGLNSYINGSTSNMYVCKNGKVNAESADAEKYTAHLEKAAIHAYKATSPGSFNLTILISY